MSNTSRLLKLRDFGYAIQIGSQPYEGVEVEYLPRNKYDSKPWEYGGYRFSSGELRAAKPGDPESYVTAGAALVAATRTR